MQPCAGRIECSGRKGLVTENQNGGTDQYMLISVKGLKSRKTRQLSSNSANIRRERGFWFHMV